MQAPLNRMLILNFSLVVGKKNSLNCVKLFLPFLMLSDIAKRCKSGPVVIILAIPLPRRHGGPVVENVACTSLKRRRRCQITKFGNFLPGHHLCKACVCYHQSNFIMSALLSKQWLASDHPLCHFQLSVTAWATSFLTLCPRPGEVSKCFPNLPQ